MTIGVCMCGCVKRTNDFFLTFQVSQKGPKQQVACVCQLHGTSVRKPELQRWSWHTPRCHSFDKVNMFSVAPSVSLWADSWRGDQEYCGSVSDLSARESLWSAVMDWLHLTSGLQAQYHIHLCEAPLPKLSMLNTDWFRIQTGLVSDLALKAHGFVGAVA